MKRWSFPLKLRLLSLVPAAVAVILQFSNSLTARLVSVLAAFLFLIAVNNGLAAKLDKLNRMATRDSLTGLANFRRMMSTLREETKRARRYQHPLCLLIIDLDKFKQFNDSYGHMAGNNLLREAARTFTEAVRECDTVARFGGDEFVVILPETSLPEAKVVAERLVEETKARLARNFPGEVGLSVGVSAYEGEPVHELLAKVDKLVYQVKKQGGSSVLISGRHVI